MPSRPVTPTSRLAAEVLGGMFTWQALCVTRSHARPGHEAAQGLRHLLLLAVIALDQLLLRWNLNRME